MCFNVANSIQTQIILLISKGKMLLLEYQAQLGMGGWGLLRICKRFSDGILSTDPNEQQWLAQGQHIKL